MSIVFKTLKLPLTNGEYIFTKEAVKKIHQAYCLYISYELVNHNEVKDRCFLQACVKEQARGKEITTAYNMPINVIGVYDDPSYGFDVRFSTEVNMRNSDQGPIHPILGLIRTGAVLYFEPRINLQLKHAIWAEGMVTDAIYWKIKRSTKEKEYRDIFSSCTTYPEKRLIREKPNKHLLEIMRSN